VKKDNSEEIYKSPNKAAGKKGDLEEGKFSGGGKRSRAQVKRQMKNFWLSYQTIWKR